MSLDAGRAAWSLISSEQRRQELYHRILCRCCDEIERVSRSQTSLIFQVPACLAGDSSLDFNQDAAMCYLRASLERLGYTAAKIDSGRVYVSWHSIAQKIASRVLTPEAVGTPAFDERLALEDAAASVATRGLSKSGVGATGDGSPPSKVDAFLESLGPIPKAAPSKRGGCGGGRGGRGRRGRGGTKG